MKVLKLQKYAVHAMSAMVLALAAMIAAAPCGLFFYQPKTPCDIKARLAKSKAE